MGLIQTASMYLLQTTVSHGHYLKIDDKIMDKLTCEIGLAMSRILQENYDWIIEQQDNILESGEENEIF
jgi:hypothetical protein